MAQPRVFHLLQRAHSALFRASDQALKARVGLSTPQQAVLFYLMRNDGVPISAIADDLRMGCSSLSGLIDRMAERGLVERRPNREDARSVLVFIKEDGCRAAEDAVTTTKRINAALLEPFSRDERAVIQRFLQHISDNAEAIVTTHTNDDIEHKERIAQ